MSNKSKGGGPKTDKGKEISSRNSMTHGLTAKSWINDDEQTLFDTTVEALTHDFDPQSNIERMLISKLAECTVRLTRIQRVEDAMFDLASSEAGHPYDAIKSLDNNSERLIEPIQETTSIKWKFNPVSYHKKIKMFAEIDDRSIEDIISWDYVEKYMPFNTDYICDTSIVENTAIYNFVAAESDRSNFITFKERIESSEDTSLTIDEIFKDAHEISASSLQKYFDNLGDRLIRDLQVQTVLKDVDKRTQQIKDSAMPDTQKLSLIQRYRTANENRFSKSLGELFEVQKRRRNV